MTLAHTFRNIAACKFFEVAGYSYKSWWRYGGMTYGELPKDLQDTVKVFILDIYQLQKMVYSYELELTAHYMKMSGIFLKPFFKDCGLPAYFFQRYKNCGDPAKLMAVRMGLMAMVSELIEFVRH